MSNYEIVCLLPARNEAANLPEYFECVSRFADAVVALDDGSTDNTLEILARQPLVAKLLTNPRRDSYHGWDDAKNRNRLLEACCPLNPKWVLSLDADERIPADDAAAMLDFLRKDALPDAAYGFRVHRMIL